MEKQWVDFRTVKAAVTMSMVLQHYGINRLRKKGDELRGTCPIHQGEGTDTFHVSLSKNVFNCFSCKASGNVIDLVAVMEQSTVRDAALKLQQWFNIIEPAVGTERKPRSPRSPESKRPSIHEVGDGGTVNNPLTFELRGIDPAHSYLASRCINQETAERFGVGFFPGKGSMAGRVVIPIHNERGELVAYAGRSIDDREPKYKFPAGFHKSLELFNLHRVGESDRIVVVEGFFDCVNVCAAGFPCVALMGSSLSEQQEQILVRRFKQAMLLLDGDRAGREASVEIAARLVRKMWTRIVDPGDSKQPDQLDEGGLKQLLAN